MLGLEGLRQSGHFADKGEESFFFRFCADDFLWSSNVNIVCIF